MTRHRRLTTDGNVPRPLADTASGGTAIASDGTVTDPLFDNTCDTGHVHRGQSVCGIHYATGSQRVVFYT